MLAGVDIGSRTTKAVILDDGAILAHHIITTGAKPMLAGKIALDAVLKELGLKKKELRCIVATGYGRVRLLEADQVITELTCHARGTYFLDSQIRTVIDIGGQDSKVIRLSPDGSLYDFVMNDKCAAGTGRFLESAATVMEVDLDALSRIALTSVNPCTINSTCAVFAESEIISLLAADMKASDIAAGLYQAFAQRIGNLARRLRVMPPMALVGGGAKSQGLRHALMTNLNADFTELTLDPQLVGALGAAVIAADIVKPNSYRPAKRS
jgi:(R)-2-hydroxyacyl-CoA dehydratese activating ATPase